MEQIALYNLVLIPYAHGEVELSAAPEAQVKWVGPVIFRGKEESPSREAARRLLRLNEDQLCFLVSQGGGGGTGFDKVMAWLYRIAERYPEIQFVEAVPPLTPRHNAEETPANLSPLRHFPLVDYLNAFDAAISASGANSSTELVCFGVPTIWLPVGSTETTGQNIRAEKLVSRGLGIAVERFDDQALCNAIDNLLRPEYSHEMREKMLNQPAPHGAQKSADEICKWLAG